MCQQCRDINGNRSVDRFKCSYAGCDFYVFWQSHLAEHLKIHERLDKYVARETPEGDSANRDWRTT